MTKKRKEEYIAEEFDGAAQGYDKSKLVKSFQRRAQILVINSMRIEKGMNILDLGCGTGWGAIDIAYRLEGTGKVVGMDLSKKMIEQANQNTAEYKYTNVVFEVGSGSSLDFNNQFDYVLSTNAFHHFENKEDIFLRVWRSLKHNGVFIIQDICDDYLLMKLVDFAGKVGERAHVGSTSAEGLRNLFQNAGFMNIEVDKKKLSWFWKIMIGKGTKQIRI